MYEKKRNGVAREKVMYLTNIPMISLGENEREMIKKDETKEYRVR